MVPFVLPQKTPDGRSGDISHVSGGDPEVCPAKACICVPFTRLSSSCGRISDSPSPMIHMVKLAELVPPELVTVTV